MDTFLNFRMSLCSSCCKWVYGGMWRW